MPELKNTEDVEYVPDQVPGLPFWKDLQYEVRQRPLRVFSNPASPEPLSSKLLHYMSNTIFLFLYWLALPSLPLSFSLLTLPQKFTPFILVISPANLNFYHLIFSLMSWFLVLCLIKISHFLFPVFIPCIDVLKS